MAVPYTFGTATSSIPLSQLDSNFATAITIGNTAVQLGNTVTTLNNLTLANVTISSGNVTITNVSVTTANATTANVGTLVVTANATVAGNVSVTGNISASANISTTGTLSVTGASTFNANAIISTTDNTNAALRITQLGTGNALLVEDETNPDSTPFVINASGNVVVGNTSSLTISDGTSTTQTTPLLQLQGASTTGYGATRWSNNTGAPWVSFGKSRGSSPGTRGVVASGDPLGYLGFVGDDGTNFIPAALIRVDVDGTPGTNDMPGRLVFSTTADGASSPTERMRINSAGNVGIGTSSPTALLTLAAGTATANTGPLKFTSGTNLSTPEAGAVEYDGTVMTATTNTNFKRGTVEITTYASGTGTVLGTNTEATLQALLPAANDTITLSAGTYFLDVSFIITRGPTSTTSATARLNILGTGGAIGNFSGMSLSAPTAGGATANFSFDAVNINTSNVLTAASTTAAGVYTMNLRGMLKITTGGTIIPQYNLSANINAAGTIAKVLYFNLTQLDSQSATATGPSGNGWA